MKPIAHCLLVGAMVVVAGLTTGCGTPPGKKITGILMPQSGDTDAEPGTLTANVPGSPYFGIHAPKGWASLPIVLRFEDNVSPEIRSGMQNAARTWNDAAGFDLIVFDLDHAAPKPKRDLYSRLDDGISSIGVESNWRCIGKSQYVLGTTVWDNERNNPNLIVTGDIVLNTDFYVIGDAHVEKSSGYREVVDAETLALHELGHLIGLAHIPASEDDSSVMSPTVYIGEGIANREVSDGDLERVRRIYSQSGISERIPESAAPAAPAVNVTDAAKQPPVPGCEQEEG